MHPQVTLPSIDSLLATLQSTESLNAPATAKLEILDRKSAAQSSTFPSEVVSCRSSDGQIVQLFLKYAAGKSHDAHGHRRGVSHEAAVYRELLQHCRLSTPTYYASRNDPQSGETILVLEYLEDAVRITKSRDTSAVPKAAQWIAEFHSIFSSEDLGARYPFLRVYNEEYFLGWPRRTLLFSENLRCQYPWMDRLCTNFAEQVSFLLTKQSTIVHGEFYPKNILYQDGNVLPVDWESTAISTGEIDLASLTESWPDEVVKECEAQYVKFRYPNGAPEDFQMTLNVARLYLIFRWLGDRPEWTNHRSAGPRFEELHRLALQMGLL